MQKFVEILIGILSKIFESFYERVYLPFSSNFNVTNERMFI